MMIDSAMRAASFPVHKLCHVHDTSDGKSFLLAATGPCIQSLSCSDGQLLSIWPRDENTESSDDDAEGNERPSKRVKLSRDTSELSEASIEIVADGKERQKGERRRPKIPNPALPHVSHLITTSDAKHAIAVTAEDKAVRVFSISRSGRLRQLSSRSMPKKSCAVILSSDEKSILTADKFGDVYAIPLHPSPDYVRKTAIPQTEKAFEPSASSLTVHTKGNLASLEQQKKQKQKQPRKEGPEFEHKLLLGHVSLLTDLKIATGMVNGKPQPFILTADRDEHIRVSRGMPQSHVIHTFCFGHTDFVSKLCPVPWAPDVLIAGNGEPSLRVYDWQNGVQKSQFHLLQHDEITKPISAFFEESQSRAMEKLAVSGIWPIHLQDGRAELAGAILVALEGLPILLCFKLTGYELSLWRMITVDGNVLEVTATGTEGQFVIGIDKQHTAGSCKELRVNPHGYGSSIETLQLSIGETGSLDLGRPESAAEYHAEAITADQLPKRQEWPEKDKVGSGKNVEAPYSALGEFIYGLENLRKRKGVKGEDDEEEDVETAELTAEVT